MSAVSPAAGKAMRVSVNGNVLKSSTFNRERSAGEIPLPTSGLTADADSNYEVPHAAGMITTTVRITSIFDTAAIHSSPPLSIRAGVVATLQFGMTAAILTPAISFVCLTTTDSNDAEKTGLWEATFKPATDDTAGNFS